MKIFAKNSHSNLSLCPVALGVLGFVLTCLAAQPISACRYNVRDVGFVDLGSPPYKLLLRHDSAQTPELEADFLKAASAQLFDINVRVEIVDVSRKEGESVLPGDTLDSEDELGIWLLDDENRTLRIPLIPGDRRAAWSAVKSVVTSPLREKIISLASETYATVLVIEGSSATANARVAEAVKAAILATRERIGELPKAVESPPISLTLSAKDRRRETLLLWALGAASKSEEDPLVAIIYGRGRTMGPVLADANATKTAIADALWTIGQSCECDLDRRVFYGRGLPLQWTDVARRNAAQSLGFDPESPLVKSEISRILNRGKTKSGTPASQFGAGLGYSEPIGEASVDSDLESKHGLLSEAELERLISGTQAPRDAAVDHKASPASATDEGAADVHEAPNLGALTESRLSRIIWIFAAAVAVIATLAWISLRRK